MLLSLVAFAALANGRWGGSRWDGSWKRPAGAGATPTAAAGAVVTPPARKPNRNLNQRPPLALFCLKLDNSCCYVRYSCGNNCNVVVKLVQECKFFMHFTSVLRKQFARNDTFLREANSYKWALALRNSRQLIKCWCSLDQDIIDTGHQCCNGDFGACVHMNGAYLKHTVCDLFCVAGLFE